MARPMRTASAGRVPGGGGACRVVVATMPEATPPTLRGRRGRDRRLAERVAEEFANRHAPAVDEDAVDFDAAAVDSEVEDARREAARARSRKRRRDEPRKSGHRLPDLSVLPPLLAETGSFGTIRERIGTPADVGRVGRHAGVVAVPHGAKSYLAAALALDERIVCIARDAEIGDRVAEELQAWLGVGGGVAVLDPRTALAYERSELVADETAARVAALAAWRHGRARVLVASVQALLQHTIAPDDLPAEPRELKVGARLHQDTLLRDLFQLGYAPVTEVAGRGEFARRGGIVDVFPPSMELPIRVEFFGDEIDSLRSFDRPDRRTTGGVDHAVPLPASDFLLPEPGVADIRGRLGRSANRLSERLVGDLARFEGTTEDPLRPTTTVAERGAGESRAESRALSVGDAAEVWAPYLAPSTALDHIGAGTLLIIDEPGDVAEAAAFLWRQADERRAELVDAAELPKDWQSTYLPA